MYVMNKPVELDAARRVELRHLRVGEHAGHHHHVLHAAHHHLHAERVGLGHRLISVLQPRLHQPDLGRLSERDASAEDLERLARAVRRGPTGHLHGLRVVGDHAGHEGDVRGGVRAANAVDARLLDAGHRRLTVGGVREGTTSAAAASATPNAARKIGAAIIESGKTFR